MPPSKTKNAKRNAPARAKRKQVPAKAKQRPAKRASSRADFGAPIEGFFAKQPAQLRAVLDELRKLVEEAAPDADSSIKWGMPVYSIGGAMMCALGGHKSHVNLVLAGPPDAFVDPEGRLEGTGKTGRHLKLTSIDDLPRANVRGWLRTAAELAREK